MDYLKDAELVVAVEGPDGKAIFLDHSDPLETGVPGSSESLKLWRFEGDEACVPGQVGGIPTENTFTGPGGATFALICFPPHSGPPSREEMIKANPSVSFDESDDDEMHRTNSIDMGCVLSGQTDLKLPGGEVRTLKAGNVFVVAGARHAWENPYAEPCVFTNVIVGVRRQLGT